MINDIGDVIHKYKSHLHLFALSIGTLTRKVHILPMHCNFDYENNVCVAGVPENHFFHGSCNLGEITTKIFSAEINTHFMVKDTLTTSTKYIDHYNGIYEDYFDSPTISDVLTHIINFDEGFDEDITEHLQATEYLSDSPYFRNIQIQGLDNRSIDLKIAGLFFGDSDDQRKVENLQAYLQTTILYASLDLPFYKALLVDAYQQIDESNYKTSAYLSYNAFESFINTLSPSRNTLVDSLTKFEDLFSTKFVDGHALNTCESFIQLKTFLEREYLGPIRDSIANGNENGFVWIEHVDEALAVKMFVFTSLVILIYEQSYKDFTSIDSILESFMTMHEICNDFCIE